MEPEATAKAPAAYVIVFAALLVLLGVTVGAAFVDLGHRLGLAVALGIAGLKAMLIVLFFMHVSTATHRVRAFAIVGVVFVTIMVTLTLSDYLTRGTLANGPHEFRDPNNVQR